MHRFKTRPVWPSRRLCARGKRARVLSEEDQGPERQINPLLSCLSSSNKGVYCSMPSSCSENTSLFGTHRMPQLPLPEGQACYGAVTLAGGTVLAPEAEFQWQQGCVVQAEQRLREVTQLGAPAVLGCCLDHHWNQSHVASLKFS